MRECQKVFFNLKSALVKIEKQRKIYLRKQKPIITPTATTPSMLRMKKFFHPQILFCFLFSYSNNNYRNIRNINMYID